MTTVADVPTAQRCQGTPTLAVIDNRSLVVRSVQYNRSAVEDPLDELISQQTYSPRGHLTSSIDPRLWSRQQIEPTTPPNFRYVTSLTGRELQVRSQDAGDRLALYDVEGAVVWQQDSRNQQLSRTFDTLHRLTSITERSKDVSRVSERLIYAEAAASSDANQRGQLLQSYSPAGLSLTPSYSITGQLLTSQQQFLRDDILRSDWAGTESIDWAALAPDIYLTRWAYDALGQQLQLTDAQNNQQRQRFNLAGQLAASELLLAGQTATQAVLRRIEYSAAGQVLHEEAGNSVVSDYVYEPQTQRLSTLTTTRPEQSGRATLLQSLTYQYDPVGNLLAITDAAKATRYTRNQRVEPASHYAYDALYQLCQASGRENANAGQQTQALPPAIVPLWQELGELTHYTRRYTYDRGNNLTAIQHVGLHPYTQQMVVASTSNRAVQQTNGLMPGDVDSFFDACGNLQQLTAGQPLSWDSRNQLLRTTQVVRSGLDDDREVYWYDSAGQRATKLGTALTSGTTRTQRVRYLPGLELRVTEQTQSGSTHVTERLQVIQCGAAGRLALRVLHWELGQPTDIENNQYHYSLDDQLGSSLLEVDQQADILTWEEYYPFGGTAVWSARNETETQYKFVRYSGKERDATGLYYYGFRYYASWLGRWLNPDPAGTIDGLNLFCMVGNNPSTFTDGDGRGKEKAGYIYSPFSNTDAVNMTIGENARRILKGKAAMPVILSNVIAANEFLKILKDMSADESSMLGNTLSIIEMSRELGEPLEKDELAIAEAALNIAVQVNTPRSGILSTLDNDSKIYILGHGSAGNDSVYATTGSSEHDIFDELAISDLAEMLDFGGLPKDYKDIRVVWCESADAEPISSFQTIETPSGKKISSAQKLADALGAVGFSEIEVTGYKGSGTIAKYTEDIHMKQIAGNSSARRRDVKKVFTPSPS